MSRPLRIEYPGAWYHVMNGGRRGEEIFTIDEDRGIFIDLLRESVLTDDHSRRRRVYRRYMRDGEQ